VSFMVDGKVQLKCVPAVKRMDVNKRKVIVVIAEWKSIPYLCRVRLYTELFMLSSLPCFTTFCHSAIPTSCYVFDIITSESKSLWGEPERAHRVSAVDIEDECTV